MGRWCTRSDPSKTPGPSSVGLYPYECCINMYINHGNDGYMWVGAQRSVFEAEKGPGAVLFLCSVVLSRGLDNTSGDMDGDSGTMIGGHNYCTQEMVSEV